MKVLANYSPKIKILSLILTFLIVFYLVPASVYAEGLDTDTAVAENSVSENEETSTYTPPIYEVTELREDNVKHFRLENGSYIAAQYNYPVHYTDKNGQFIDINNSLADSGSELATGDSRIKFAKKITGSGKLFNFSEGNTEISVSILNANKGIYGKVTNSSDSEEDTELQKKMNLENLSSKILYEEIFTGVDIEYVIHSTNVKENIIVKERAEEYIYSFEMKLKNLTPIFLDDGSISLTDNDGNIKYSIPAPIVYDAAYTYAKEGTAKYSLEGKNNKYTLTVTVDTEWMDLESTLFPVTVDPTITTVDNTPYEEGLLPSLMCVQTDVPLEIILSDVPNFPDSAVMTSATMSLWYRGSGGFFTPRLKLSDTITEEVYDITEPYKGYTWDITELLRKWWSNSWTSRSLTISVYDRMETLGLNVPIWLSRPSDMFTINTPIFEINYTSVMGVEDYYTYSSHSLINSGNGHINLANGNLTFVSDLTSTTDYIMPMTISAVYNSYLSGKSVNSYNSQIALDNSYMAYGFKLNITETIIEKSIVDNNGLTVGCYILSDEDGTEHYFYFSGTEYIDDSALGRKIKIEENEITVTYKNHIKKTFIKLSTNPYGTTGGWVLSKITDAVGNSVIITLNNSGAPQKVSLIPKGQSEKIDMLVFGYVNGMLSSIDNLGNKDVITFKYSSVFDSSSLGNSGNYLRAIEYKSIDGTTVTDKTKTELIYNSSGTIASISDSLSGHSLKYSWGNKKVFYVIQNSNNSVGQAVKYSYHNGHTDVETSGNDENIYTSSDNIVTRYIFDELSRAVSIYSIAGDGSEIYGATVGKYETQENAKNYLKEIATMGGSTANYLLNSGFEAGIDYWHTSGLVTAKNGKYYSTGNYSLEISSNTDCEGVLSQNVYLDSGNYTFSLKYAISEATDEEIYIRIADNGGVTIAEKRLPIDKSSVSEGFSIASMSFELEESKAITASIIIKSTNGKYFYVDDIMLEKGLGVGEYNMIESGGFENSHIDDNFSNDDVTLNVWENVDAEHISIYTFDAPFNKTLGISNGGVKQTVYASDSLGLKFLDPSITYRISGFARASDILCGGIFRLAVNVYYYQGRGESVCVTHYFDFANAEDTWQFTSGLFRGTPSSSQMQSDADYSRINKIEVVCEFSGQNQGQCAYFDNISLTDASKSSTVQYGYDEAGNLCMEKSLYDTVYYEYDYWNNNNLISVYRNSTNEELIQYSYNDFNLVTQEIYTTVDTNGALKEATTEYNYNDYGQPTSIKVIGGDNVLYSTYVYDTTTGNVFFGALTESTDTTGITTKYIYRSCDGRLMATLTEGDGVSYSYDTMGRLTAALPATINGDSYSSITNAQNVSYTYNSNGFLSTITTDSTTYTFTYDNFGNAESIATEKGALATYEYNNYNGKLKKVTYGNGYVAEYFYNALELLERVCYTKNDSKVAEYVYTYTRDGQLHSTHDTVNNRYTVYEYDSGGKLLGSYEYSESDYVTDYVSAYHYDSTSGMLSEAKYKWNYVANNTEENVLSHNKYTYNYDGSVATHELTVGAVSFDSSYTYDEFKRVVRVDYVLDTSNTMSEEYTYAEIDGYTTGLVEQYTHTIGSSSSTYSYTYDSKGNISIISKTGGDTTYNYDDCNQLTSESTDKVTHTYVYDNAGNITSIKKTTRRENSDIFPTPLRIAPNLPSLYLTETTTFEYTDSEWGDLLTSFDGTAITYDEIGNPLSYYNGSAYTFTWTGRQLATAVKGSKTMSFTYNDEGIRTSKTVNGVRTEYILNGSQILGEITDTYIIVYMYDAYGSPIGMQYKNLSASTNSWQVYWYSKNLQGDIVAVCDSSGAILITYKYDDAWGNYTTGYTGNSSGAAWRNPFKYRGYYYDSDLGMYYLQSRYYDSKICRFINADSELAGVTGGLDGYNLYSYCFNNPVMYSDHAGNWPTWAIVSVGVLAAVAAIAITVATLGAAAPAAACGLTSVVMSLGISYATANAVATVAVVATTAVAAAYAGDIAYSAVTGESILLNAVFQGNVDAYNAGLLVSSIATAGMTHLASQSFGVCFVAGTIVKAAEGDIPIESIQIGDYVYAHNPETGETELKSVVNTFVNEATELVHVFTDGEEIICTNEHPFYSPVKGWIEACKLRAGDILVSLNGEYVVVEQVQHETLEAPIKVYNFEVEDFHTYFVGNGDGVLVHNTCSNYNYMSKREINKIKSDISAGRDVTFKSKQDAINFINNNYSFPQESAGQRSANGWHFDAHDINGIYREHINLYSKTGGFRIHIFWEGE